MLYLSLVQDDRSNKTCSASSHPGLSHQFLQPLPVMQRLIPASFMSANAGFMSNVHMYTYMYGCESVCVFACACVCVHVHVRVHVRVCVCVCLCVCMPNACLLMCS